jgi:hypothetical protein
MEAYVEERSSSLTEIGAKKWGQSDAILKRVPPFLRNHHPYKLLKEPLNKKADFVTGNLTEIEHLHTGKNASVKQTSVLNMVSNASLSIKKRNRNIPNRHSKIFKEKGR